MAVENLTQDQPTVVVTSAEPLVKQPSLLDRLRAGRPTVFNVKKRGKRRYSKELKGAQIAMRDLTRLSTRIASAVADGMREFRKRESRSSFQKKDGALRDVLKNSARGLRKTLRGASEAPLDLARAVHPGRARKRLRRLRRRLFRW